MRRLDPEAYAARRVEGAADGTQRPLADLPSSPVRRRRRRVRSRASPASCAACPTGPVHAACRLRASRRATFRHPQAKREIRLGRARGRAMQLRRARRRSIGFVVGAEGLSVSAPRWVGARRDRSGAAREGRWILRKLHEQQERARRLQAARVDWRDGTQHPVPRRAGHRRARPARQRRGAQRRARRAARRAAADAARRPAAHRERRADPRRRAELAAAPGAARVRGALRAFRASAWRARERGSSLTSAQTRWGSASADGSIRLNWRLIHFALPTIDYVVAHELAHLREMNHSPRFWDVVRSVVPDYEGARGC